MRRACCRAHGRREGREGAYYWHIHSLHATKFGPRENRFVWFRQNLVQSVEAPSTEIVEAPSRSSPHTCWRQRMITLLIVTAAAQACNRPASAVIKVQGKTEQHSHIQSSSSATRLLRH